MKLHRYLVPYWPLQSLVILATLLSSSLGLIGPLLTRATIDEAFGKHDLYLFNLLLLAGLVLYVYQGALRVLTQYLSAYVGNLLTFDVRRQYVRHLFGLSLHDFHRRSTGEQIYRLGADIDTVGALVTDSIPQILGGCLRVAFLLGLCFYLNWRVSLATLLVAPLLYLHSRYFGGRQSRVTRDMAQASQDATAVIQDALANVKLVKLFGRTRWAVREYLGRRIAIIRLNLRFLELSIFGSTTAGLLNTIALTGLTYYIGLSVIRGGVTLGTLVALILYLTQLVASLAQLGGLYRDVMSRLVAWQRVQQTLTLKPEESLPVRSTQRPIRGGLACRGVTFGYAEGRPVLKEVSFEIRSGEFIGVVGPSGSGKTTLLMLLLGLLRPWSGRITLDGLEINRIDGMALRRFAGVAPQEASVLNQSIADNLRLSCPEASDEQMRRALAVADLEETVRAMPEGLGTRVGEMGGNLSEGQRQRLSIARAFIHLPQLLVLDEATSAIGFDSESRILAGVKRELPGATILFSSHRLSSLKGADRLLVLRDGVLIAEGSHDSLMKQEGFYRTLYDQQSSGAKG